MTFWVTRLPAGRSADGLLQLLAADKKTPTGAQPVGVISLASREAVSGEPHRPLVSPPIILSARRRSRFSSAPAPKA